MLRVTVWRVTMNLINTKQNNSLSLLLQLVMLKSLQTKTINDPGHTAGGGTFDIISDVLEILNKFLLILQRKTLIQIQNMLLISY